MAGNEQIQAFLENIAGKAGASLKDLSSAQKSRFYSWAKSQQLVLDDNLVQKTSADSFLDNALSPTVPSTDIDISVGIDIQHVNELNVPESDWKSSTELSEIFSASELAYCETRINPLESLAGIFAAKEAVFKASSFDDQTRPFVEINHDKLGKPTVESFDVSISHSTGYAVAIALRKQAPAAGGESLMRGSCQVSTQDPEVPPVSLSVNKNREKIVSWGINILLSIIGGAIGCWLVLDMFGYI